MAGGDAADGGSERVFGAGDLEGARHDALNVAVAIVAKRFDNALAGDDADELRSADDGKVFLQRMYAASERVGERVRWRESGEVREHNLAHVDSVDDGLEEDALVFDLRADHDEESRDDEPGAVNYEPAEHHDCNSDELTEAGSSAFPWGKPMDAREVSAQQTAEVEWIGGKQVQEAEAGLHPDHAANKVVGGDERARQELDISACPDGSCRDHEGGDDVNQRSGECHGEFTGALVRGFLTFGIGVGEKSADGKQQDRAKLEIEAGSDDKTGRFPYKDGSNAQAE